MNLSIIKPVVKICLHSCKRLSRIMHVLYTFLIVCFNFCLKTLKTLYSNCYSKYCSALNNYRVVCQTM